MGGAGGGGEGNMGGARCILCCTRGNPCNLCMNEASQAVGCLSLLTHRPTDVEASVAGKKDVRAVSTPTPDKSGHYRSTASMNDGMREAVEKRASNMPGTKDMVSLHVLRCINHTRFG